MGRVSDTEATSRAHEQGYSFTGGKTRSSRHGIHYFDRRSGFNVLLDEVVVPETEWARAPRFVSMALTNACELRCAYCYAPKHPAMLHHGDILRWAEELDTSGSLGVGFGGGEPTGYPHFAQLCRSIAERTQLAVTFTTHGHRMTADLAALLAGAVHFIRVSVDGVGRTYERLRGRRFDDLARSLGRLASIAPFGVNVVVNAHTLGELDDIAAFAVSVGARELLLLPEQPTGLREGLDPLGSSQLVDWITNRSHALRTAISRSGLEAALPVADPFPGEDPFDAHVHVDASGTLKPDAFARIGIPIHGSIVEALGQLRILKK